MNDRVLALQEFMELKSFYNRDLNEDQMKKLYIRIFNFSVRYFFAEPIDIYVDIKHFIKDGVKRIKNNEDVWYKQDFIDAGLLTNTKVNNF